MQQNQTLISKNEEQIEKFIAIHDKKITIFKNLCENQLSWNVSDENINWHLAIAIAGYLINNCMHTDDII